MSTSIANDQAMMPRMLPIKEVCRRIGLSRSTIWEMSGNGKFPKPVELTQKRKAFVEEEVNEWLTARIAERDRRAA